MVLDTNNTMSEKELVKGCVTHLYPKLSENTVQYGNFMIIHVISN